MKNLSIRMRVTLWYAALMFLLAVVTLLIMLVVGQQLVRASSESKLIAAVDSEMNEVHVAVGQVNNDNVMTFDDGVYLLYCDTDGDLLAGTLPVGFETELPFQSEAVRTSESGGVTWYLYDAQRAVKRGNPIWIRGVMSSESAETSFSLLVNVALIALPLLVILAVLGGYLITGRALRPIKRIAQTARQISDGKDLGRRIALGDGRDEIYALAAAFDHMLDRLQASFEREKQFASDASHELRTPISVVIAQCEYALEHAKSKEDCQEALEPVLSHARKMSGMIAQLLALTRAGQGREPLHMEKINPSELCLMVAEEQKEPTSEKSIAIHTEIQPDISFLGDETLLMRMLINLISNAIQYGRENGTLTITLKQTEGQVSGSVNDDGVGISKEDLPRI